MDPTPTKNDLPLRKGDFTTLTEALDYAAQGNAGYNFYDGTGKLNDVLPYKRLRKEARSLARRLPGLGPRPGARVALVADTHPDLTVVCPVGSFLRDVEKTFGKKSKFVDHMTQSKIEVLKGIRSLVNERIEQLGKRKSGKTL
ncbi:MAG: hypothetical protein GY850_35910 [bacterium]|nr:hypothetical protein [bacterium]